MFDHMFTAAQVRAELDVVKHKLAAMTVPTSTKYGPLSNPITLSSGGPQPDPEEKAALQAEQDRLRVSAVCVRAHACVRACVYACVCLCVRVFMRACVHFYYKAEADHEVLQAEQGRLRVGVVCACALWVLRCN